MKDLFWYTVDGVWEGIRFAGMLAWFTFWIMVAIGFVGSAIFGLLVVASWFIGAVL